MKVQLRQKVFHSICPSLKHDYWTWGAPWSVIHELEVQESWCCASSLKFRGPSTRESNGVNPNLTRPKNWWSKMKCWERGLWYSRAGNGCPSQATDEILIILLYTVHNFIFWHKLLWSDHIIYTTKSSGSQPEWLISIFFQ